MLRKLLAVLFCLPITGLQGCASIITGTRTVVSIRTDPSEAEFTIYRNGDPIHTGTTPQTVQLQKRGKYSIRIEKNGYDTVDVPIRKSISGWYIFGNLIFGGLIGYLIVDPLTGAIFTFKEKNTKFILTKKSAMLLRNGFTNGLVILSINDIPENLRPKLVSLTTANTAP